MIFNLVIKDARVFGKSLLIATLLFLVMDNFFITIDTSWETFVLLCTGQISYIMAFYSIQEKMKKGDLLICSLPLKRSSIVLSRYLTCSFIAVIGILICCLDAVCVNSIFISTPDDLDLFINPYVLFIITFYLSLFISIFIPTIIYFNKIRIIQKF